MMRIAKFALNEFLKTERWSEILGRTFALFAGFDLLRT
jgi:hypothetical protein